MSPMGINEQGMSRKAALTVFGSVITVFVFFNYVAQPIRDYETVKIQVAENEKDIGEVIEVIDAMDRLVALVEDHEESLNNIGPIVVNLKASNVEYVSKLNDLISFANSGDRFTAQDGALLAAQVQSIRELHSVDTNHIMEKMDELKDIVKEVQNSLEK